MHTVEYLIKIVPTLDKISTLSGELHCSLSEARFYLEDCVNYTPKHFSMSELVPKEVFVAMGLSSLRFLDVRAMWTLDALWVYFNHPSFVGYAHAKASRRIFVNTWSFGGMANDRGFRMPDSSVGKDLSQHKFGRAFDCTVEGVPIGIVRNEILEHSSHPAFRFITEIEEDVPHLHFACPMTGQASIKIIHP